LVKKRPTIDRSVVAALPSTTDTPAGTLFLTVFDNRKLKRCKNKVLGILLKNLNLIEPQCLLLRPKNQTALLTGKKHPKRKTNYFTDREHVSAPLSVASEFQSKLGARTMLKLEAVMRFISEFFDTKFKNLENKKM
jgi:hypothetical protein